MKRPIRKEFTNLSNEGVVRGELEQITKSNKIAGIHTETSVLANTTQILAWKDGGILDIPKNASS